MKNLELWTSWEEVPKTAQKPFDNGRFKGTDIDPMWRLKTLTEAFGSCGIGWYYEVTQRWREKTDGEECVFVDINLYIKVDGEWSKPIHGTGGSKLIQKNKRGDYVNDECYKMATTDAISVACKNLGIGANIYWGKGRTKYTQAENEVQKEMNEANQTKVSRLHIDMLKEKARSVGFDFTPSVYGKDRFEDLTEAEYGRAMNTLSKMQMKGVD